MGHFSEGELAEAWVHVCWSPVGSGTAHADSPSRPVGSQAGGRWRASEVGWSQGPTPSTRVEEPGCERKR